MTLSPLDLLVLLGCSLFLPWMECVCGSGGVNPPFSLLLVWSACGPVSVTPLFSLIGVVCCWPRWCGSVLFCPFAYSMSEILNNPLSDSPSSMSLLYLPIFFG